MMLQKSTTCLLICTQRQKVKPKLIENTITPQLREQQRKVIMNTKSTSRQY
jgi:hypothetical protein